MIASTRTFISLLLVAMLALAGCETDSAEQAATKALDDLQTKYDELLKDKVDVPVDWAAEDLENIGDWEYRVETITYSSPEEFAEQLNVLGNERWEVIWLERTPGGFLTVLKKPSISYLSKVPLSEIGRYVIGGSGGQE